MSCNPSPLAEAAPRRDPGSALAELLAGVSIEATPRQIERTPDLAGLAPAGTQVYLPSLPGSAFGDREPACRRLAGAGRRPVVHLAARAIPSRAGLDEGLARYREAGADAMLLIAGDLARPRGPFASTFDVLETGLLVRHGVRRLGIAGHPEGHVCAGPDALLRALRVKAEYARQTQTAMWVVTQFVFSTAPWVAWDTMLRDAGVTLPVRLGVPGPARRRTLLAYALQCGIGASARALRRRPGASRMLGRWTPETLVDELAAYWAATPESRLAGLHLVSFGGLAGALRWLRELEARRHVAEPAD